MRAFILFFSAFCLQALPFFAAPMADAPGASQEEGYEEEGYEDGYDDMEDEGYDDVPEDVVAIEEGSEGSLPEVPASRSGFSMEQAQKQSGPVRLVKEEGPAYVEERPWQPPAVSNIPPQTSAPVREHPPVEKELAFGQTDWNQIDLHSLTRDRIDRG